MTATSPFNVLLAPGTVEGLSDFLWFRALRDHEEFWDQYRDEQGAFIDGPGELTAEDHADCYWENGPDGQDHEAEMQEYLAHW